MEQVLEICTMVEVSLLVVAQEDLQTRPLASMFSLAARSRWRRFEGVGNDCYCHCLKMDDFESSVI